MTQALSLADRLSRELPELLQQLFIRVAPGAVQITGNGKAQVLQSECLGCGHPAPNRS